MEHVTIVTFQEDISSVQIDQPDSVVPAGSCTLATNASAGVHVGTTTVAGTSEEDTEATSRDSA